MLEQIGYGGMAVVYRARQETLDRTVAVKILSENMAASPEFMERFRREARTAANLRHPNVITVYDFGEDERGVPYLVMEYIEGPTLADLMDAGLDDERIPDLLDQIAAGLDYAHARGVIHRDIKPGNVLMTEEGRAVLADFGLAWLLEGAQLTLTGGMIGTPEYMSPEQAAGHAIRSSGRRVRPGHRAVRDAGRRAAVHRRDADRHAAAAFAGHGAVGAAGSARPATRRSATCWPRRWSRIPPSATARPASWPAAFRAAFAQRRRAADIIQTAPATSSGTPRRRRALVEVQPAVEGITCARSAVRSCPSGPACARRCRYHRPARPVSEGTLRAKARDGARWSSTCCPQGISLEPRRAPARPRLSVEALRRETVDGWEPTSHRQAVPARSRGRTISGSVVESTVLTLERLVYVPSRPPRGTSACGSDQHHVAVGVWHAEHQAPPRRTWRSVGAGS